MNFSELVNRTTMALKDGDTIDSGIELFDGYSMVWVENKAKEKHVLIVDCKAEPPVEICSTRDGNELNMLFYFLPYHAARKEK